MKTDLNFPIHVCVTCDVKEEKWKKSQRHYGSDLYTNFFLFSYIPPLCRENTRESERKRKNKNSRFQAYDITSDSVFFFIMHIKYRKEFFASGNMRVWTKCVYAIIGVADEFASEILFCTLEWNVDRVKISFIDRMMHTHNTICMCALCYIGEVRISRMIFDGLGTEK